jgi:hypothetical protein
MAKSRDSRRFKPHNNGTLTKSGPIASKNSPDKGLAKVTLYVRPDQVIAVEAIQLQQRMRTGSRLDKSALVQEALDLLIGKYKPRM